MVERASCLPVADAHVSDSRRRIAHLLPLARRRAEHPRQAMPRRRYPGDGGYVISWWCAGFGCLDHSPPAPWPDWLLAELTACAAAAEAERTDPACCRQGSNAEAILRRVANAAEGERNGVLFWAANRLRERGTPEGRGGGTARRGSRRWAGRHRSKKNHRQRREART